MTPNDDQFKTSFAPVSNSETRILILGTLPGERSLQMAQYYAHPNNRFWRIMAALTKSAFPANYEGKLKMLLDNKIGVWDVVQAAKRVGSLDTNIVEEVPNDLERFINLHPKLEAIAFNGSKAQKLYDKYFERRQTLKYLPLPSTSPANAGFKFEGLLEKWREILLVLKIEKD
jgi:hypoxanthine-DNA glycosylase